MHLLLAFLLTFMPILVLSAGLEGLTLEADSISRDYEARTVILEGKVRIGFAEDQISCDKAVINMRKQVITATGNVVLKNDQNYIEGERIIYDYKSKTGEIHKGYVQAGQVVFSGDLILQKSKTGFLVKKADFTACTTCPAAWSFSGNEIEAEVGGYAYIKYPVLRIADFPVLILPRIWVPLKSDRQSGVLVPSLDYSSSGGTAFSLPYFWAISRSQDLTYTLKRYEKRGFKHLAGYRYVLSPESFGNLEGAYLKDEAFTANGQSSGERTTFNRGFLAYNHYYELPDNYVQRANLNISSDLRYPRDFSEELAGHGDSALENKVSLTRNTHDQNFSIEGVYFTNLLKTDALDDNTDAVHKAPEINYSFMQTKIFDTNLFFKFDFNYTNFARRDFSYDDVLPSGLPTSERDGNFDHSGTQKDQIRTGHRYILQPALSFPFHLGKYLDVNPSLTYNETQYRFNLKADPAIENYEQNAERRYLQTDISLKTKYSAVFGKDDGKSNRYKHEIEPEFLYSQIPYVERPQHIFFGDYENQPYSRSKEAVSNSDFFSSDTGLQFDYRDRLFDKDLATFVLSNYVVRKTYINSLPTYQKFVTFRLAQSYDFNEARRPDSKPWSNISSLLDIRQQNFETHTIIDYYPYSAITNTSSRLKVITLLNSYLELNYTNSVIVDSDQQKSSNRTEYIGTGIGIKSKYLDIASRTNYSTVTEKIESWEYLAELKPPGDCWTIKFGHKKTLGSDTNFRFSLNFEFAGI